MAKIDRPTKFQITTKKNKGLVQNHHQIKFNSFNTFINILDLPNFHQIQSKSPSIKKKITATFSIQPFNDRNQYNQQLRKVLKERNILIFRSDSDFNGIHLETLLQRNKKVRSFPEVIVRSLSVWILVQKKSHRFEPRNEL